NYMDFNSLSALDLFSGTGSIGMELLSRGCEKVVCVEKDKMHHAFICKIMDEVKTGKCLPIRGDVFKFINNTRETFDFIFADPPYELPELETIPELVFKYNLLKEEGLFVLEHGKGNDFEERPYFMEKRTYGSVNFSFFRKRK
ncbi:Ribosomal RNA small subunit methyltransferase D, partial [termite gut metagenome]